MTDYNDGKWHGWNGGECPVHPNTPVKVLEESGPAWIGQAKHNDWPSFRGAFRVIRPYQEPNVVWVNEYVWGSTTYPSKERAEEFADPTAKRVAVRYVEQPE